MNLGRYAAGAVTALMTVTVFTACSNGDPDTVPLGTGAPLGGPSNPNNTSVAEKSPHETAEAQAEQAIKEFFSVYNKVNTDYSSNIDDLNNVLGDPALQQYRSDIILRRSKSIQGEGDLKVVSMKVVRSEVPDTGNGQANIEIQTCVDSSEYKSTRPDGKSDLRPDRLPRQLQQFWVQNGDWPNDTGWLVVGQSLKGNTPCKT